MVEKSKIDKSFNGGKKGLSTNSPGDASRFGNPKGDLMPGYNENQGEFASRTPKVKESGLKQTDPETGRTFAKK